MLNSYRKISIIYGGKGRDYATRIRDKIEALHFDEHYPVYVRDLNTFWMEHNFLKDVIEAIKDSDMIIVLFTLDDVGTRKDTFDKEGVEALKGRLRQNILIELGMALVAVGDDMRRIHIFSDFNERELGNEFPSDLESLHIDHFNEKNFEDKVLVKVDRYIKETLQVVPTTHILHEENATEDFENVFSEFDKLNIYSDKKIKSLHDIMNLWLPAVKELNFPEEKLLYALQRIKSLPIFGSGKKFCEWLEKFKSASLVICDNKNPDYRFVNFVQDIADVCFRYTIVKSDEETEGDYNAYYDLVDDFEELEERYNRYLLEGVKIRPLIGFLLFEYYGLTLMRMIRIKEEFKYVDKTIELYQKCLELSEKIDTGLNLYEGYTTYNLGRAYFLRYEDKGNKEDFDLFVNYMKRTMKIRRKWKDIDGFFQCYVNALSYEYFYALGAFTYMKKKTNDISEEEFHETLDRIVAEIDSYICKDSELMKLHNLKKKIMKMNKEGA